MMAVTPHREPEKPHAPAPTHTSEKKPEKPEQLVHGVKNITSAAVGTVIDSGPCNITQILYTGAPSNYEVATFAPTGSPLTAYFCLVDQGTGVTIYNKNFHTGGGFSPHATHKVSGYTIAVVGNIYLQSCPIGATFSITTA